MVPPSKALEGTDFQSYGARNFGETARTQSFGYPTGSCGILGPFLRPSAGSPSQKRSFHDALEGHHSHDCARVKY
jgi:hypothetical protein